MNKKLILKEMVKSPFIKRLLNLGYPRSVVNKLIIEELLKELDEPKTIEEFVEIIFKRIQAAKINLSDDGKQAIIAFLEGIDLEKVYPTFASPDNATTDDDVNILKIIYDTFFEIPAYRNKFSKQWNQMQKALKVGQDLQQVDIQWSHEDEKDKKVADAFVSSPEGEILDYFDQDPKGKLSDEDIKDSLKTKQDLEQHLSGDGPKNPKAKKAVKVLNSLDDLLAAAEPSSDQDQQSPDQQTSKDPEEKSSEQSDKDPAKKSGEQPPKEPSDDQEQEEEFEVDTKFHNQLVDLAQDWKEAKYMDIESDIIRKMYSLVLEKIKELRKGAESGRAAGYGLEEAKSKIDHGALKAEARHFLEAYKKSSLMLKKYVKYVKTNKYSTEDHNKNFQDSINELRKAGQGFIEALSPSALEEGMILEAKKPTPKEIIMSLLRTIEVDFSASPEPTTKEDYLNKLEDVFKTLKNKVLPLYPSVKTFQSQGEYDKDDLLEYEKEYKNIYKTHLMKPLAIFTDFIRSGSTSSGTFGRISGALKTAVASFLANTLNLFGLNEEGEEVSVENPEDTPSVVSTSSTEKSDSLVSMADIFSSSSTETDPEQEKVKGSESEESLWDVDEDSFFDTEPYPWETKPEDDQPTESESATDMDADYADTLYGIETTVKRVFPDLNEQERESLAKQLTEFKYFLRPRSSEALQESNSGFNKEGYIKLVQQFAAKSKGNNIDIDTFLWVLEKLHADNEKLFNDRFSIPSSQSSSSDEPTGSKSGRLSSLILQAEPDGPLGKVDPEHRKAMTAYLKQKAKKDSDSKEEPKEQPEEEPKGEEQDLTDENKIRFERLKDKERLFRYVKTPEQFRKTLEKVFSDDFWNKTMTNIKGRLMEEENLNEIAISTAVGAALGAGGVGIGIAALANWVKQGKKTDLKSMIKEIEQKADLISQQNFTYGEANEVKVVLKYIKPDNPVYKSYRKLLESLQKLIPNFNKSLKGSKENFINFLVSSFETFNNLATDSAKVEPVSGKGFIQILQRLVEEDSTEILKFIDTKIQVLDTYTKVNEKREIFLKQVNNKEGEFFDLDKRGKQSESIYQLKEILIDQVRSPDTNIENIKVKQDIYTKVSGDSPGMSGAIQYYKSKEGDISTLKKYLSKGVKKLDKDKDIQIVDKPSPPNPDDEDFDFPSEEFEEQIQRKLEVIIERFINQRKQQWRKRTM